jgi:hypothetical protein
LQDAATRPALKCEDDRLGRFYFSASHNHFGMAIRASRHCTAERCDKLISRDRNGSVHNAGIVGPGYFEILKAGTEPTRNGYHPLKDITTSDYWSANAMAARNEAPQSIQGYALSATHAERMRCGGG